MLKRIYADNFRALVSFEFRPGRLCLLLGDNGSGKTSVFDVLGKLHDLIVLGATTADRFAFTRTKWETRELQRFELDFEESIGTYRYALEIQPGPQEKPVIQSESVTLDGEPLYRFSDGEVHLAYDDRSEGSVFPFRADQSFLTNLEAGRTHRLGRLTRFRDLVAGLRIIQPNPFIMEVSSRQDLPFLARNGVNFASFFDHLNDEQPDVREELQERLREVIPGFRRFRFQRIGQDAKLLLAAFDDGDRKGELNLMELSEGQRVLVVLYTAVLAHLRSGSLLCFDEADNFVSLTEIQPWLQLLRDTLDERGGQVLVISHHPEVMDYMAVDEIWRFERPAGPVIARPYEADGPADLKLSELIAHGA